MTGKEMIDQLIKDLEELKESPHEAVKEMLFDGLDEGFIVAKVNEIDGYAEVRDRYRADFDKFERLMEEDKDLAPLFES